MNDLAKLAIETHGGLDRWRQRLLQAGVLWGLTGKDGILNHVHVTADLASSGTLAFTAKRLRPTAQGCRFGYPGFENEWSTQPQRGCGWLP
jgi:hypothetical protein